MILSKQSVCTLRLYTILFYLKCDEDTKSIGIKNVENCWTITYWNRSNWCYNYTSHTGMWLVHLNIYKYKIRKIIAIKKLEKIIMHMIDA